MCKVSEIEKRDIQIAQLQDTAYDLLNLNLNHSPILKFPFLDNVCRRGIGKITVDKLQSALIRIQGEEHLLEAFHSFRVSMENRDVHDSLLCFFRGLFELISLRKTKHGLAHEEILLDDISYFRSDELKHDAPVNICLENIASLFEANKDLFRVVCINGSLGSNDYIPGWSDVDIFAMISEHALCTRENFNRLLYLARQIKREIFSYNRLQAHSVFYTLETEQYFHRYAYYPIVCLQRGRLLVSHESKLILRGSEDVQEKDASNSYRHIYHDFIRCNGMENKSVLTKVHLIHRLFMFPLLYLAKRGIKAYKADSFDLLQKYLSDLPDVTVFCEALKDAYVSMKINYSHCFRLRRLLMNVVNPSYVNNFSLRIENEQAMSINRLYAMLSDKGLFEQVEKYWVAGLTEQGE